MNSSVVPTVVLHFFYPSMSLCLHRGYWICIPYVLNDTNKYSVGKTLCISGSNKAYTD